MPKPYAHHVKSAQGSGRSLEGLQGQNLMGMMSPTGRVQSNPRDRGLEPVGGSLPRPQAALAAGPQRPAGGIYGQPAPTPTPQGVPITGRRLTDKDLLPPAYVRNARPREFWRDTVQPYAGVAWNMSLPGMAYNYLAGNEQAVQEGLQDQVDYWTRYLPDAGKAGVNSFLMYDALERDPVLASDPLQNWAGTSLATGAHALTAAATGGSGNAALAANAGRAGAMAGAKTLAANAGRRAVSVLPARAQAAAAAAASRAAPVATRSGQALYEGAFALPDFSSRLAPGALRTLATFGEQGAKGMINSAGSAFNPLLSVSGARMAPGAVTGAGSALKGLAGFGLNSLGRGWGLGNFAQGAQSGLSSAGELLGDNPDASLGDVAREIGTGMAQRVTALPNTMAFATIPASLASRAPQRDLALQDAAEQGVPVEGYSGVSYPDTAELERIRTQLEEDYPDNPLVRAGMRALGASTPFRGLETYSERKSRDQFDREQSALSRQGLGAELEQRVAGPGSSARDVLAVLERVSPEVKAALYGSTSYDRRQVQAELQELARTDPQAFQVLSNWHGNRNAALQSQAPYLLQSPGPSSNASRRLAQAADPYTMALLLNDPSMMQAFLGSPSQSQAPYGSYAQGVR